jgi:hypothetical protein
MRLLQRPDPSGDECTDTLLFAGVRLEVEQPAARGSSEDDPTRQP